MNTRPHRTRLVLTPAGTILLPVALLGLILSLSLVTQATLFTATILSVLLLAPASSYLCLRGLVVVPPRPRQAFVGEGFPVELTVQNRAFFLAARHVFLWHGRGGRRRDQAPSGRIDVLDARSRQTVATLHRMMERGRHRQLMLVAASSYPFGLVECRREFDLTVDFLALPCPGRLGDMRRLMPARSGSSSDARRPLAGDEELYGVREWREGESLRHAHWKLSARLGRTMLREFRGAGRPPIHLILSTFVPARTPSVRPSGAPPAGVRRNASFERAVRLTTTLAQHFLREGHRLRLTIDAPEPSSLYSARGGRTLIVFLAVLAEVQPVEGKSRLALDHAPEAARLRPSSDVVMMVVVGGDSRRTELRSGERLVLDVDDPATDRIFRREQAAHLTLQAG